MLEIEVKKLLDECRLSGPSGHRALGRLLRLVDDNAPGSDAIDESIKPSVFHAARVGLTGPPGSGKSSLIACAIEKITSGESNEFGKVGVLAVDPTSPFTGGALLGDRVRLKGPTTGNIFFRSLASRGSLGGVSRAIWPSARLLDWWGADVIIIETVGSGQLGTSIGDVADLVVAVLTPEAGDGIQSMKAGVMELADCFVVNKSDRPGAQLMMKELNLVKEEASAAGRDVEVYLTSAVNEEGIDEAVEGILALWKKLYESGEIGRRRCGQVRKELKFRTEGLLHSQMMEKLGGSDSYEKAVDEWTGRIMKGEVTVAEASRELIVK